jgi:hypothetical protein
MAAFPLGPGFSFVGAQERQSSTRHTRKISVAFINIVVGKNCLVRQHADASNIFRGSSKFFREKFRALMEPWLLPRREETRNTL